MNLNGLKVWASYELVCLLNENDLRRRCSLGPAILLTLFSWLLSTINEIEFHFMLIHPSDAEGRGRTKHFRVDTIRVRQTVFTLIVHPNHSCHARGCARFTWWSQRVDPVSQTIGTQANDASLGTRDTWAARNGRTLDSLLINPVWQIQATNCSHLGRRRMAVNPFPTMVPNRMALIKWACFLLDHQIDSIVLDRKNN